MGCFWAYFLFSRIAQTLLGVGMLVLLVHGLKGIAILFVSLLTAGFATEWRMRTREAIPHMTISPEAFTPSEHVSRETAHIPWRREVKGFSMAPPAARLIGGELIGLGLGIAALLLIVGTLAWLGGLFL
jgi:ABC-type lipoprotein release transport system permease subunit